MSSQRKISPNELWCCLRFTGSTLFFTGDTVPPKGFSTDIANALANGKDAGCYTLSFDHKHWFLKANCWFTRFDVDAVRFGDRSLFVTKEKFNNVNGFCEKHIVLEDQHIIRRLKKQATSKVMPKPVITSARKYLKNGIYKTQALFFLIYLMYFMGFSQQKLVTTYRNLVKQDKI